MVKAGSWVWNWNAAFCYVWWFGLWTLSWFATSLPLCICIMQWKLPSRRFIYWICSISSLQLITLGKGRNQICSLNFWNFRWLNLWPLFERIMKLFIKTTQPKKKLNAVSALILMCVVTVEANLMLSVFKWRISFGWCIFLLHLEWLLMLSLYLFSWVQLRLWFINYESWSWLILYESFHIF